MIDLLKQAENELSLELEWMLGESEPFPGADKEVEQRERRFGSPIAVTDDRKVSARDQFLATYEDFRAVTIMNMSGAMRTLLNSPLKISSEESARDKLLKAAREWEKEADLCHQRKFERLEAIARANASNLINEAQSI